MENGRQKAMLNQMLNLTSNIHLNLLEFPQEDSQPQVCMSPPLPTSYHSLCYDVEHLFHGE